MDGLNYSHCPVAVVGSLYSFTKKFCKIRPEGKKKRWKYSCYKIKREIPKLIKRSLEDCNNFYLWQQIFLMPIPEEKLSTRQGLLPQDFCIFADMFKLSFLRAAAFIVSASAFLYIQLRLPNFKQHPSWVYLHCAPNCTRQDNFIFFSRNDRRKVCVYIYNFSRVETFYLLIEDDICEPSATLQSLLSTRYCS